MNFDEDEKEAAGTKIQKFGSIWEEKTLPLQLLNMGPTVGDEMETAQAWSHTA